MAAMLRVLIVDEDPDSRVMARKALGRAGFDIAGETGFGTAAVTLAITSKPDVILVAVEEPAGRALETAEGMAGALPDTPVLFYSSDESADAIRRSLTAGARDHLVKPLQAAALRESILRALEQEERRQLRRSGKLDTPSGRGTVITVTGAKGGIGKSVVSVNLALALRQETGKPVLIIDADTHFGDVATMLDVTPSVTIGSLLPQVEALSRDTFHQFLTPHPSGLQVLAGPLDDEWDSASPAALKTIIDVSSQLYEFVVVDTNGSLDGMVRAAIECATVTFILTSGEVSSIRDTVTAFERLKRRGIDTDRVRVVLNRGRHVGGVSLAELQQGLGRDVFWEIPFDKAVPESVQFGRPLVNPQAHSAAANSLVQLARRTAGTTRSLMPLAIEKRPFWERLPLRRGKEKADERTMAPIAEVPEIRQ